MEEKQEAENIKLMKELEFYTRLIQKHKETTTKCFPKLSAQQRQAASHDRHANISAKSLNIQMTASKMPQTQLSSKYSWSRTTSGASVEKNIETVKKSTCSVLPVPSCSDNNRGVNLTIEKQLPLGIQSRRKISAKVESKIQPKLSSGPPAKDYKVVEATPHKYKLNKQNTARLENSFNAGLAGLSRSCISTPISELRKTSETGSENTGAVKKSIYAKKSRFKLIREQKDVQSLKNKLHQSKILVMRNKNVNEKPFVSSKDTGIASHSDRCITSRKSCSGSKKMRLGVNSKYRLVKPALVVCRRKPTDSAEVKKRSVSYSNSKCAFNFKPVNRHSSSLAPVVARQSVLLKSKYKLVKQAVYTVQQKSRRDLTDSSAVSGLMHNVKTRKILKAKRTKYSIVNGVAGKNSARASPKDQKRNISRNKFRFIAGKENAKGITTLPQRSKLKLDRRIPLNKPKRGHYVTLKGQLYLKQRNRLTRIGLMKISNDSNTIKTKSTAALDSPYKVDRRRKSVHLQTVIKPTYKTSFVIDRTCTQMLARNVLAKSLATAMQSTFRKDNTVQRKLDKTKKFCIYYNRFGKCSRGTRCPFIHDPNRIALCSRFLRGKCRIKDCHFSHKLSKEKMPVCSYFMRGRCARENCPYLHVNVGLGAEICIDFVNGYCEAGEKCKKKHTVTCPAFEKNGACPDGVKCKFRHIKKGVKRTYSKVNLSPQKTDDSQPKRKRGKMESEVEIDDRHLPLSQRVLPSFISLTKDDTPSQVLNRPDFKEGQKPSSIQIRPVFSQE